MYNVVSASCWINNWPGSENMYAKMPADKLGFLWEFSPSFCDVKLRNDHPEGDSQSSSINQSNDSSRILPYVFLSYVEPLPFFNSLNLVFSTVTLFCQEGNSFSALIVVVLIFLKDNLFAMNIPFFPRK